MANTDSKSMLNETTGGSVTENNAEKSSAISEIVISGTNACSVAKTMSQIFTTSSTSKQQQQNFTSLCENSSSMSSLMSTTTLSSQQQSHQQQHQQLRKVHTLSFLHNEDLLSSKSSSSLMSKDFHDFPSMTTSQQQQQQQENSSEKVTKMIQKQALTLSRSISFNDPRRQQFQRSSVQRTESTKEYDIKRKMTILSPIHSNFHGCFDSSSELSSM
jgi:hypothetical protein